MRVFRIMFATIVSSKIKFLKYIIPDAGLKRISHLKLYKTCGNICFYTSGLGLNTLKPLSVCRYRHTVKISVLRNSSVLASEESKIEKKPYFQELLSTRKMQAKRSVLLRIMKKDDIPYAITCCEKYGCIKNAYSYSSEMEDIRKWYVLLEFTSEGDVQKLLSDCRWINADNCFPIRSRLIYYDKNTDSRQSEVKINDGTTFNSTLKPGASISEVIEYIYLRERLTELEIRLRFFFCTLLTDSIFGIFPDCDAVPFDSTVNGLGKYDWHLDIMLNLLPEQAQGNCSELTFSQERFLRTDETSQGAAIKCFKRMLHTFLPGINYERIKSGEKYIENMHNRIFRMDFDLIINNMSAVRMSEMMYFCGEIDSRMRPLAFAVKKWARETSVIPFSPVCRAANFWLPNLVIFFLQNRPCPILPPLKDIFVIEGKDNSLKLHYLKTIEELKNDASLNKESLAELLKEFFSFLAGRPFEEIIICLMSGKEKSRYSDDKLPLWVQYPFDESLNITKNISASELEAVRKAAKISAECLEINLKQEANTIVDFSNLLGIPPDNAKDAKSQKSNRGKNGKISKNKTVTYSDLVTKYNTLVNRTL